MNTNISASQSNQHDQFYDQNGTKAIDYKNISQYFRYPACDQMPYYLAVNIASSMSQGLLSYGNVRYTTKKDPLRKGKWTHEEEMYTNKIIEAFNAGLLKLPENNGGVTLRSYLAEKLGCDPMRITKKYTGASCLGKRVYHNESSSVSSDEIEKLQKELDGLESKFLEKLEQVRRERREHESAIDGMFITPPHVDAMLVHGGVLPMQYNNVNVMSNFPHPYHHLSGPMSSGPGMYMSRYPQVSEPTVPSAPGLASKSGNNIPQNGFQYESSDKLRNDFYSISSPGKNSTISSLSCSDDSSASTIHSHHHQQQHPGHHLGHHENHITNLANPSQLAYIQMLASCGPYISTQDDRSTYQANSASNRNSKNIRNHINKANSIVSDHSGDNTDEDKNYDSSIDGYSTSNLRQSLKQLNAESVINNSSISNGDSTHSDTSSNANSEEDRYPVKSSKNHKKNHNNNINMSASTNSILSSDSHRDDDHIAASSLIGFFNQINRTSIPKDLAEFVEDIQQKANVPSDVSTMPHKRHFSECEGAVSTADKSKSIRLA